MSSILQILVTIVLLGLAGLFLVLRGTFGFTWRRGFDDLVQVTPAMSRCGGGGSGSGRARMVRPGTVAKELTSLGGQFIAGRREPWLVAIGAQSWPSWTLRLGDANWGRLQWNEIPFTMCTGVVLAAEWVLTSAHCVRRPWSRYWVTAGTDCRPEFGGILLAGAQRRRVAKWYRRFPARYVVRFEGRIPKLRLATQYPEDEDSDLALLRLESPLELNSSEPAGEEFRLQDKWTSTPAERGQSGAYLPRAIPLAADCEWPAAAAADGGRHGVTAAGWGYHGVWRIPVDLLGFQLGRPRDYSAGRWKTEPIVFLYRKEIGRDEFEMFERRFSACGEVTFCVPIIGQQQTCSGDSGGPWVRYSAAAADSAGGGQAADLIAVTSGAWFDSRRIANLSADELSCGHATYDVGIRVCDRESRRWIHKIILSDEFWRRRRGEEVHDSGHEAIRPPDEATGTKRRNGLPRDTSKRSELEL